MVKQLEEHPNFCCYPPFFCFETSSFFRSTSQASMVDAVVQELPLRLPQAEPRHLASVAASHRILSGRKKNKCHAQSLSYSLILLYAKNIVYNFTNGVKSHQQSMFQWKIIEPRSKTQHVSWRQVAWCFATLGPACDFSTQLSSSTWKVTVSRGLRNETVLQIMATASLQRREKSGSKLFSSTLGQGS